MEQEPGAQQEHASRSHAGRPAVRTVPVTRMEGDAGTGANTVYGNEGGNHGMVIRSREDRDR